MNTPPDCRIYIVYYKPGQILKNDDLYAPLMSGNVFSKIKEPFLGDDLGENISAKNSYYSELTGIYWIWKNTKQDVTGVCHYRRFYTLQPEPWRYKCKRLLYYLVGIRAKRHGLIYTRNVELFVPRILNQAQVSELLSEYDAILPQARKLKYSVREHYHRYHDSRDLTIIETILTEKHPDYLEAFHAVLRGKRVYANNMFILKDVHYKKFMAWWFDMLSEFEKRTDLDKYTGYQKRIIGFVAERLLTVWFEKEQLNCKELQLIYFKSFKHE